MARVFDAPIITGDQNINRVLTVDLPLVLVFLDRQTSTTLEQPLKQLARQHAGRLLVVQMSRDEGRQTAGRYGVNRFPALVTVRDGQTLTTAEAIAGADLEKHAAYLLGRGPKPEPPRQTGPKTTGTPGNGGPRIATDATFDQEVLRASEPVLVDFWAPWCGPCRMVDPILKTLAREMAGRLRIVKVNVDENPAVARRYGVQSIPTMMVVKNGQVADRWMGALPESTLRSKVMPFLN